LRLKRFGTLLEKDAHPINNLQIKLGGNDFMRKEPKIDIDPSTTNAMVTISKHNLEEIRNYDTDELEFDRLFRLKLCKTKIVNIVKKQVRNYPALARLRRQGILTIHDALNAGANAMTELERVSTPEIQNIIANLATYEHIDYTGYDPLNIDIYDSLNRKWQNMSGIKSRNIRKILDPKQDLVITQKKTVNFNNEIEAVNVYKKTMRTLSLPLCTKILRLLCGDVFCGVKLVRANLADTDTCNRCFDTDTLQHRVSTCSYSKVVWKLIGIERPTVASILSAEQSKMEFEIHSCLVETVIFRRQHIPPKILVQNTH
jgi:hypothetical protein